MCKKHSFHTKSFWKRISMLVVVISEYWCYGVTQSLRKILTTQTNYTAPLGRNSSFCLLILVKMFLLLPHTHAHHARFNWNIDRNSSSLFRKVKEKSLCAIRVKLKAPFLCHSQIQQPYNIHAITYKVVEIACAACTTFTEKQTWKIQESDPKRNHYAYEQSHN